MPRSSTARKQRRSFSLSAASIRYIELVRREKHADSASAALEQIIEDNKLQRRRRALEDAVSTYYDSLSDAEQQEQREWGYFAESEFPRH